MPKAPPRYYDVFSFPIQAHMIAYSFFKTISVKKVTKAKDFTSSWIRFHVERKSAFED